MESTLGKTGRFLFAIPFAIFGMMHFMMGGQMAEMVPIPGGVFWVYLVGIALLAASVALIMQKQAKLATLLLGIMLVIFALGIHLVAVMGGDQMAMSNLLKDLALAGAAFFISAIYDERGEA